MYYLLFSLALCAAFSLRPFAFSAPLRETKARSARCLGPIVCTLALMKKPFDLKDMLQRIEKAVAPYPKAAMFELYERGYTSLFEQLVSYIISIRTLV